MTKLTTSCNSSSKLLVVDWLRADKFKSSIFRRAKKQQKAVTTVNWPIALKTV